MTSNNLVEISCTNCAESLMDSVFIECADCPCQPYTSSSGGEPLYFCIDCFSCGAELGTHKKHHRYRVKNNNGAVVLFKNDPKSDQSRPWTSREEFGLLEGIERFNLGNWEDVANHYVKINNCDAVDRTPKEIREHYDRYYLRGSVGRATADNLKRAEDRDHTAPIFATNIAGHSHPKNLPKLLPSPPLRECLRKISPDDFRLLAYMPQRDDFEKEFNNDAETLISNLMILPDDDDLDRAVKVAQIDMYIREVVHRRRRKMVARDYDLVSAFLKQEKTSANKIASYSYSAADSKRIRLEKELKDQLRKFAQFTSSAEYEQLVSDLIKEQTLIERVEELQEYRREGSTTLEGEKRLKENENSNSNLRSNDDVKIANYDFRNARKRNLTDGNECAFGRNVSPNRIRETDDPPVQLLSEIESMFCNECSLSSRDYVLYKTSLLKEELAKSRGIPLRTSVGGGSVDEALRVKGAVKSFMKSCGWISYFS